MIYFLIPVFNEAENIDELVHSLNTVIDDEEKFFVFVDDKSTDATVEKIKKCFSEKSMQIIAKTENKGPGDSFNLGFEWILQHSKNNDDRIVTLEGDNTSDIKLLPDMLTISRLGYTLVLASVYAQGGGFDKTSWFRKLVSAIANILMRFVFDIKVLTLSSFYRVYHVKLIREIKLKFPEIIAEPGFICMIEILVKAIRLKARIIEVPMVLHSQKRKGKSKMKVIKTTLKYIAFVFKSRSIKPVKS